ncbi:glycerophosphodiester phosphodiesterase [Kitasatospora sp. NPDC048365]|uniref:glycerophosphodiester phosphodiesterase n=1 Tax=Kitasatospora sp. NPDC048365 TaxID=3364050 RepID=UPI003717540B
MAAAIGGKRPRTAAIRAALAAMAVLSIAGGSLAVGKYWAAPADQTVTTSATTPLACFTPQIAGHRGSPKRAPENSIASYSAALSEGADWLETDVRVTRDGVPVLLHDLTVDRTTNGTGQVQDLTYEQVSRLRTKDGRNAQPIPRLADLLEWMRGRHTRLLMEIKELRNPQDAAGIARMASASGLDIELYSFYAPTLRIAHTAAPEMPTTLLQSTWHAEDPGDLPLRALSVEAPMAAGKAWVDAEHRRGRQIYAWTVDDSRGWTQMAAAGVDALITDDPAGAKAWRDRRCQAARAALASSGG